MGDVGRPNVTEQAWEWPNQVKKQGRAHAIFVVVLPVLEKPPTFLYIIYLHERNSGYEMKCKVIQCSSLAVPHVS